MDVDTISVNPADGALIDCFSAALEAIDLLYDSRLIQPCLEHRARVDAVDSLHWQTSELRTQIEDVESQIADLQSEVDRLRRNRVWS